MPAQLEIRITAQNGASQIIRAVTSDLNNLGSAAKSSGILLADATGRTTGMRGIVEDAAAAKTKLGETTQAARNLGDTLDSTGRQAKIGLLAAAQGADLLGLNLSGVLVPAAGAADAIGDIAGAVGTLGAAAGIIGGVIAGVAFLANQWQSASAAIAKSQADVHAKFAELQKTFSPDGATASEQFAASLGLTEEALKRVASASPAAAAAVRTVIDAQEQAAQIQNKSDSIQNARNTLQQGANLTGLDALMHVPAELQAYMTLMQQGAGTNSAFDASLKNLAYDALEAQRSIRSAAEATKTVVAAAEAAAAATQKAADTNAYYANQAQVAAQGAIEFANALRESEAAAQANNAIDAANRKYGDLDKLLGQRYPVSVQVAKDRTNEWLNTLKETGPVNAMAQAVQTLASRLRSVVESTLTPTSVTSEDMDAAKMGKYNDKWDEFRRRLEAAMSGTNVAEQTWGAKFTAQLADVQRRTGFSLDQIDAKFKNFSLFADKANLQLIDWDSVVGNTSDAIQGIIGKFNVVTAGVQAYLSSDAAQAEMPQLKMALGLDVSASEGDVQKALTGALGGISGPGAENAGLGATVKTALEFDASKAKSDAGILKKMIAEIPATVAGSVVKTIVDLAKSDTFDDTLKQIIADIDKIPAELNADVTIVYRQTTVTAGGTGTDANPNAGTAKNQFATGFVGWVGPGHGGPMSFLAGEGGEDELLMVLPKSTLGGGRRRAAPNLPAALGDGGFGGGNTFNIHLPNVRDWRDADYLSAKIRALSNHGQE